MSGYGSDSGFSDWLIANGYSLPGSASSAAVLRQRGSAYIDGLYGARFTGYPSQGYAQERAWPREGAEVYGVAIPNDQIPSAVTEASYAAAYYEATKPGALSVAVAAGKVLKRERLEGVAEREYFEGSGSAVENATVTLSTVEGLLAPFLTVAEPAVLIV